MSDQIHRRLLHHYLLSDEDPVDFVPPTKAELEGATKASAPEKATAARTAKIVEQRIVFLLVLTYVGATARLCHYQLGTPSRSRPPAPVPGCETSTESDSSRLIRLILVRRRRHAGTVRQKKSHAVGAANLLNVVYNYYVYYVASWRLSAFSTFHRNPIS